MHFAATLAQGGDDPLAGEDAATWEAIRSSIVWSGGTAAIWSTSRVAEPSVISPISLRVTFLGIIVFSFTGPRNSAAQNRISGSLSYSNAVLYAVT
jgi:hypothetical protein